MTTGDTKPPVSTRAPGRRRSALVLCGGGAKAIWQVGAGEHLIGERGYWLARSARRELQQQLFESHDAWEGISALNEKRMPSFRGA